MSDHDPEVTPEQEARLRRLLAGARHTEPVPDDVAARLDRVLEQLAAEERDPEAHRPVVDLAARRRRRVRSLLVAAAAVVVVGVGVGQVLTGSGDGFGGDASESASTADSGGLAGPEESADDSSDLTRSTESFASPESDLDDSDPFATLEPAPAPSYEKGSPRPPVRLTEEAFAKQALRLRTRPGVRSRPSSVVPGEALSRAETFVCDTADWGTGRLLAALYDDVPAVLAYRPVTGETQTADLLRCGTGEILRSTVLPVGD